ncbi:coiled-coil domain-containing protein 189 isoform X2 [Coturnix japonica]|uniref:coiled-coil domain-containing protein 189 isoform X2 n=1 Tax=Coturnix japonica TaxID=93934 RepID=UPI0013A5CFBB|nr:coiled-coil domain-containing protein 189 isoform X2 [Coturnix japonica]
MATAGSGEPDSCETGICQCVLAEVLPGPPVLLDAYEAAVELGQELGLSPGPLSALLAIVRRAISMCAQTPLPDVEECYAYVSELLLRHAVHTPDTLPFSPTPTTCFPATDFLLPAAATVPSLQHPPVSVAVFGLTQVACIAAHLFGTVLRHAKLYAYVLTPQVCLDLTLVYVDSPEHGPEGEVPTTLPEEEGETSGNPNTEPPFQEAAVPELVQVPAEVYLSKEDVSGSLRASPRSKKHLRRSQGSRQGNKRH